VICVRCVAVVQTGGSTGLQSVPETVAQSVDVDDRYNQVNACEAAAAVAPVSAAAVSVGLFFLYVFLSFPSVFSTELWHFSLSKNQFIG